MSALIITPAYTDLCRELRAAILASGLPVLPAFEHSDLPRVRSMLITQALTSTADRILLVDSDVVPTGAQLEELATSPLVTPDSALTGLYPTRDGKGWAVHAKDLQEAERGGVFEAEWAGLGFCAIHRKSLERVAEYLPRVAGEGGGAGWTPFCVPQLRVDIPAADGVRYYPDDRILWKHLAGEGVRLWADSGIKVGHVIRAVLRNPLG
jgi:hypothetical protein